MNDLTQFADHTEFAMSPTAPEAHVTLDIPPQLVWECAAGLEDPVAIAARFGFEGEKWERLTQWPPFITAVQAQRSEFERNGMTFRMKAGMMADEVMSQMFKQVVANDTSVLQKLSVLNTLTDIAGLKAPKVDPSAKAAEAPKFSITINIPATSGPTPVTIDG